MKETDVCPNCGTELSMIHLLGNTPKLVCTNLRSKCQFDGVTLA